MNSPGQLKNCRFRTLNQLEKINFRSLIENDEGEEVEATLNVIDAFLDTEEHLTIYRLKDLLDERGYGYGADFVKQCMNRCVDYGFARETKFEGQPVRYEHRHLGRHHDHLICAKCGKITEFHRNEMESLQVKVAWKQGFLMLRHKMEIYGLCSDCLAGRTTSMPLTMAKAGERVTISEITGGRTARGKLVSMGLRPGDELEIINNNGDGKLILAREYTRLALGRGLALKIRVTPAA